ncbi:MAG: ATP-binding protein [Spirochaetales bacterium]|uniref:histidine kinase n=1 Tax=Candidatus Thalassospirochaeta sargassi TaxID=3119039 RepID=A0AAJ1MLK3_9SPIO|nr:ATP-binding protein [Spirochaetales bacterium]
MDRFRKITLFIALTAAAFLLNRFRIGIIFGIDFIAGSIPVLLSSVILGPIAGAVTALASGLSTYSLWNHFYAVPAFMLEAVFVGIFFRKTKLNLVLIEIFYWFTVGIATVFITYVIFGDLSLSSIQTIALKQIVNGIVNSVIVTILFIASTRLLPIKDFDYSRFNNIESILTSFITATTILALFVILSFTSKINEKRFTEEIIERLENSVQESDSNISVWSRGYYSLARMLSTCANPEIAYLAAVEEYQGLEHILRTDNFGNILEMYPEDPSLTDSIPIHENIENIENSIFSCARFGTCNHEHPRIVLYVPCTGKDTEVGYLVMLINFKEFIDQLVPHFSASRQSFELIEKNKILASYQYSETKELRLMYKESADTVFERSIRVWLTGADIANIERSKQAVFIYSSIMNSTGWEIYVAETAEAMFNQIYEINTDYLVIICIFIIATGILSFFLVSRIVTPLKTISTLINKLRTDPGYLPDNDWPDTKIVEISSVSDYLQRLLEAGRRRTEDLMKSNQRLTTTLMSIGDAVIVNDEENRILLFNKNAAELTEWNGEDAIGLPVDEVLLLRAPDEELVSKGRLGRSEYILTSKSGKKYRITGMASPIVDSRRYLGSIIVFHDETNRIRRDTQLKNAQKMESIGLLAGGIAHDFNNLLTGIMGYADIIDANLKEDNQLKEFSTAILDTGEKAADLVQQLLSFARKGSFIRTNVEINQLIEKTTHLISAGGSKDIQIKKELSNEKIVVRSDETMLHSMLLNLGVNARDAMPEGGTITFSTSIEELDAGYCLNSAFSLTPGLFACITVSDSGTGISKDKIEQVFDPFFTTKEMGKGVGLGLATVYGTVIEMEGAISVESTEGRGTTFKILLPILKT